MSEDKVGLFTIDGYIDEDVCIDCREAQKQHIFSPQGWW